MRTLVAIVIVGFSIVGIDKLRADPPPVTLMGILKDWMYPGSEMPDGAKMSGLKLAVKCQTILTTTDPIEQVVGYYEKKLGKDSVQDDSKGRPLTLKVIFVNDDDSSTTLVISRAEGEEHTHIAWSHYLRLNVAQ